MTIENLINSGLSIIPITKGAKYPSVKWDIFQQRFATPSEYSAWSSPIGCVCGKVSGGLVAIDFDDKGSRFLDWMNTITGIDQDLALNKLTVQRTPSGGFHVLYRCPESKIGNVKLARKSGSQPDGKIDLIETRGEGGQFLCEPSDGYSVIQGKLTEIKTITIEEHELLISVAKSFNERIEGKEQPKISGIEYEQSPFDSYDAANSPISILEQHGWSVSFSRGETVYLKRPGKTDKGISATWNHIPSRFYVFTTNTAFENEHIYKPSAVYAVLEHGGNFKKAAGALIDMGYGKKTSIMKTKKAIDTNESDIKTFSDLSESWMVMAHKRMDTRFGFSKLNDCASYFSPGEVFTIAARSGVGKTTLGLKLLNNIATNETSKGLLFSLEMSGEMIYQRGGFMLAGQESHGQPVMSDFTKNLFLQMKKNSEMRQGINSHYNNVLVVDKSKLSIESIAEYILKARKKYGTVNTIAIDYLGYLSDETPGSSYEKVSRIAKGAKELAKETSVRVILLCQTSRAGEDGTKPVLLHHLRDSGAVEESADYILGMWNSASEPTRIHCEMLKNRWGQRGDKLDILNQNLSFVQADDILEEKITKKEKEF